jgi:hypothetical protein
MSADAVRVSPRWLDLRERADADARAQELVQQLVDRASVDGRWLIHDLACGSGAMGRWLAPLLPGPQRWILHDRDPDLLALAAADRPAAPATVETRLSDVTLLEPDQLAGASLITASALLDLLTAAELAAVIRACVGAGSPVLCALSVTGSVRIDPADRLDARVAGAFDAHQRRLTSRGRLLGPDAVGAALEGFRRAGAHVVVAASPWELGPDDAALAEEWFSGWIGAAFEQDPSLIRAADLYRRRRLRDARAGKLMITVGHADLLVLP